MVGTNDISGGKHRKITRLSENFKRLLGDVRVGGVSGLDFSFLDGDEVETVAGKTKPVEDENFTLKAPSAFMIAIHNLPESSSPSKIEATTKQLVIESSHRRKK